MSINTVLIFAGIPVAVYLVVAGIVYTGSARRGKRYRPGRPFEFAPVWFLSAPEHVAADRHALEAGPARGELPAAAAVTDERTAAERAESGLARAQHGVTGGASDHW